MKLQGECSTDGLLFAGCRDCLRVGRRAPSVVIVDDALQESALHGPQDAAHHLVAHACQQAGWDERQRQGQVHRHADVHPPSEVPQLFRTRGRCCTSRVHPKLPVQGELQVHVAELLRKPGHVENQPRGVDDEHSILMHDPATKLNDIIRIRGAKVDCGETRVNKRSRRRWWRTEYHT